MKRVIFALLSVALFAANASAGYVVITPTTQWQDTGPQTSQNDIDEYLFDNYGITQSNELYKADVGKPPTLVIESGPFATSYTTVYGPDAYDPANAVVSWDGGSYIKSPTYLLVKDGNQNPAWYLFDLKNLTAKTDTSPPNTLISYSWNGTDELRLEGFWPGGGAISHVTIYGAAVPEPAAVLAWGVLGLVGVVAVRRARRRV